jgi:hypothetical protein
MAMALEIIDGWIARREVWEEYEAKYTAERNYEILMGIYGRVMKKG